jgi:hypothetical protein
MTRNFVVVAAVLAVVIAPLPAAAQAKAAKATQAKVWTPPRTPDGQPDLQGTWTNPTITPFERPSQLAEKPVLTEAEAAELEKRTLEQRVEAESHPKPGDVGSYNDFWFDQGTKIVASIRPTGGCPSPPPPRRSGPRRSRATTTRTSS